jgi:ribonuclease D
MNIEIPKTETRSDWLKRPLTASQIAYALNDVRFLPELRNILIDKASDLGNKDYLTEEMKQFDADNYYSEPTPEAVFKRIKSGRLRGKSKNALMELVRWREDVAHARNIPRGHVLHDSFLISLAEHMPTSLSDIQNIQGLPRSTATHYSPKILEAIAKGLEAKEALRPSPTERPSAEIKRQVANRTATIHNAATNAGIDPLLVATKASVTELVIAEQSVDDLFATTNPTPRKETSLQKGWRKNFI